MADLSGAEGKGIKSDGLAWLNTVKAFAIAWIVLNHVVERVFSFPFIGNPTKAWPAFGERLAQLVPLTGFGLWNIPVNLVRYLGWLGDQGVTLFLIVSGFGLTWGLLSRRQTGSLPLGSFLRRRADRIYPAWWSVHLVFIASAVIIGWGLSPTDIRTLLSFAGVRFTPGLFYYFSPAWWYVGLIIQLYLVFPFLWRALRRLGPARLLLAGSLVCFASRGLGFAVFDSYLDAWQRGAVFITRLAEFVFGMSFAAWLYDNPELIRARLRSLRGLSLVSSAYVGGLILSLSLPGMVVAPFLLGSSIFLVLYLLFSRPRRRPAGKTSFVTWAGVHSYSLYLFHHPFVLVLVPSGLSAGATRSFSGIFLTVFLTAVSALALDRFLPVIRGLMSRSRKRYGTLPAAAALLGVFALAWASLLSAELLVRRFAPQEVLGWGERPSLEPDGRFGWKLRPMQKTRLRWESYDYSVYSNSLGFPGPEYPAQKPEGAYRIMVTGDAFTSAEGVDTDQAWPRLLENNLQQKRTGKVEVLNFAVTGYGPNQYARVIREYAPVYRPDLIVVELFVNEFQDVMTTDQQFTRSIGFDLPPQEGLGGVFRLLHLKSCIRLRIVEPLRELMTAGPRPHGYFLGNFAFLDKTRREFQTAGLDGIAGRLGEIKDFADRAGARVAVVMVPAPAQVCGPGQLAYYPRHVDLEDSTRFDLDLPQRLAGEICRGLGIKWYDLRPAFQAAGADCPYQRHNMHWTEAGHRTVAAFLADALVRDDQLERDK